MSDLKAHPIRMPKGTKIELFRVFCVVGESTRVEIQGFHTNDPGEMGATLAQVADILARGMARLMPTAPGEEPVDPGMLLSVMLGAMVGCLVAPIEGENVEESSMHSDFRGEPSKERH